MRNAQASTTRNVRGNALVTARCENNSKGMKMALRSAKAYAKYANPIGQSHGGFCERCYPGFSEVGVSAEWLRGWIGTEDPISNSNRTVQFQYSR